MKEPHKLRDEVVNIIYENVPKDYLSDVPNNVVDLVISTILKAVDEQVIGKDEKLPPNSGMYPDHFGTRNNLRASQRQAIKELKEES